MLRVSVPLVCHQLRKVPLCDEPPLSIDKRCTDFRSLLAARPRTKLRVKNEYGNYTIIHILLERNKFHFSPVTWAIESTVNYNNSLFDAKGNQKNALNTMPDNSKVAYMAPLPCHPDYDSAYVLM